MTDPRSSIRGLYAILDVSPRLPAERAEATLAALLAGGVDVVQLRAKSLPLRPLARLAERCRALAAAARVPFIVNDRADLALAVDADGVHLGQEDLPLPRLRPALGRRVAGISCHSLADLDRAIADGADYVGFGPVFPTTTKANPDPVVGLDGLRAAVRRSPVPVVAIGGVTLESLADVRATGAAAVALISELLHHPDVAARAAEARRRFTGAHPQPEAP